MCKAYPEAVKTDLSSDVSGFGSGSEQGDVYVIPEFELSDGSARYVIHNLSIVSISKPNIGCDLLISETMFARHSALAECFFNYAAHFISLIRYIL